MTHARFHSLQVLDRQGFGREVATRTFLAPEGWTLQGGAAWNIQASVEDWVIEAFRVTSPDGLALLELLPPYRWQGTPMSAGQVLVQVIAPFVVKTQVQGRVTRDEAAARALFEQQRATAGFHSILAMGGRVETDAAELVFTLPSRTGPREERLRCGVVACSLPGPFGSIDTFVACDVWRTSAPDGRREEYADAFAAMLASMRVNPEWTAAVKRVRDQGYAQQRAASAANHAMTMDHIRRMGQIASHQNDWLQHVRIQDTSAAQDALHDGWMQRQESVDLSARRMSEAIREVDAWRVDGGTVELPSGYERAWTNGRGEYVVTNDVGFDASRLDGTWTPLLRRDG